MRIGILTFHSANNYGAVLQCYALQQYLIHEGHDAYVIDYRPPYFGLQPMNLKQFKCKNPVRYLGRIVKVLVERPRKIVRNKNFENYRKTYLKIVQDNVLYQDKTEFDAFVYGSDQIWEWKICKGYDDVYFANFPAAKYVKNITYAASLEKVDIDEAKTTQLKKLLKNYSSISVREKSLSEKTIQLGFNNTIVLDPTLLYPKAFVQESSNLTNDYVLVYEVASCSKLLQVARSIASQLNCRVVQIKMSDTYGPDEFVNKFKHAKCIVTTSFHGMAFSIVFKKPFYVISVGTNADNRTKSLLDNLGIPDRMINPVETIFFEQVDYKRVESRILKMQDHSSHFLHDALGM